MLASTAQGRTKWKSNTDPDILYFAQSGQYKCVHPKNKGKIDKELAMCRPLNIYKGKKYTGRQATLTVSKKGQVRIYLIDKKTKKKKIERYHITRKEAVEYFDSID